MLETLNVHQAKTHLSRLLDRVARGGSVVIARAGKPVARLVPLDTPERGKPRRLGFMKGQLRVPDDFDRMGEQEIEALFGTHP